MEADFYVISNWLMLSARLVGAFQPKMSAYVSKHPFIRFD